jgi:HEAT repeat protein
VATEECEIDAGGLPLNRIKVTPAESIAILSEYVSNDSALHAISLHSDPAAAPVLARIAREHANARARSKALFWLASSAQRTIAREELARAVDQDPETEVKKSAVHALSRLPGGEGIPKLMELAQTHKHPEVRKQAMFWLGQSKDPRAIDFFEKILTK